MGRFSVVGAGTDAFAGALAAEAFQERNAHPAYGDFARVYYPIVFGESVEDCSFLVTDGGAPALFVQCSLKDGVLSHYGFPVRFHFRAGVEAADALRCARLALGHMDETAAAKGIREARISGGPADGLLSPVDRACLDRAGRPELRMRAEADLSRPEEALRRDVRDSYRSLINWGRRNLRLVYVNAENPDRSLIDDYADFHARTAGRTVHGDATWAALFGHIAAGAGEATMGYLDGGLPSPNDPSPEGLWPAGRPALRTTSGGGSSGFAQAGELVAGSLVVDGDCTALYFSAVYDRDRFDKPMGHWPLFDAMVRAKARGRRYFDLGEFFAQGTAAEKEYNIGFFKKGFTSRHVTEVVWRIPFRSES